MMNPKREHSSLLRSQEPDRLSYRREIFGVVLGAAFIFLLCAFISYNPHDRTFFHFSSKQTVPTNWCGMFGAQAAALFFFLFGSAAYVVLACLAVVVWLLFKKVALSSEVGRLVGLGLLTVGSTSLCAAYHFDLAGVTPGGFFGVWLAYFFAVVFGAIGMQVVLFAGLWVGILLVVRTPMAPLFMTVTQVVKAWLTKSWLWIKQKVPGRAKASGQKTMPANLKEEADNTEQDLEFWHALLAKNTATVVSPPVVDPVADEFLCPPEVAARFALTMCRVSSQIKQVLRSKIYKLPNTMFKKNILALAPQDKVRVMNQAGVDIQQLQKKLSLPSASFFPRPADQRQPVDVQQEVASRAKLLEEKLLHFGIKGTVTDIKVGPIITLFEYKPEIDSKISKIMALEDDLAMALTTTSIRILAPIPGKNVVGFEIANAIRRDVYFADVFASKEYREHKTFLPLLLGVDVVGRPVVHDLVRMPHLLIGGATGSGKSVGLHAIIAGLLSALTPDHLNLIFIDPKRLEFTPYADIPHLVFPIVTEPSRAATVLKWVCQEMEERYEIMALAGVRNIQEYHKVISRKDPPVDREGRPLKAIPFLVIVIDELADLMMVAGKEVETAIVRIAQMARASGIHLIVATQRPSVDVVTGLIKVNFPSRIAFRVSSKVDSRTILDTTGAEKLLGRGDLLFMNSSSPDVVRIHGAYIADSEIASLATWWREQQAPSYLDLNEVLKVASSDMQDFQDELYKDVLEFVRSNDEVSISMIQRYFRIGFNRSARLIEKLEMDGIIAPAQGAKPRKVLR